MSETQTQTQTLREMIPRIMVSLHSGGPVDLSHGKTQTTSYDLTHIPPHQPAFLILDETLTASMMTDLRQCLGGWERASAPVSHRLIITLQSLQYELLELHRVTFDDEQSTRRFWESTLPTVSACIAGLYPLDGVKYKLSSSIFSQVPDGLVGRVISEKTRVHVEYKTMKNFNHFAPKILEMAGALPLLEDTSFETNERAIFMKVPMQFDFFVLDMIIILLNRLLLT